MDEGETAEMDNGETVEGFYEHTRFALEATDSVLWGVNSDTGETIRLVGPVDSVFHLPPEDLDTIEQFLNHAVHPEDLSRVQNTYVEAIQNPSKQFNVEFRTHPDNGPIDWIEATGRIHTDLDHSPLIGISTTITERKRRQQQLHEQNDRLEQFVGVVSHDLRTPLSVATGRVALAKEECDSDHLQAATRALERTDTLLDDLLTVARDGTDDDLDVATIALGDLCESCWATVATEDATLQVDTDQQIQGEESRLRQLFENLFQNAIDHGGTDVTVTVDDFEDGFYVEDDGPGIPPEKRDDVFDAGYSTAESGTGFGLSIVEQVVEAHEWTIRVTDGAGGGARFEITNVAIVD